jgi:hypothetical protein
MATMTFLSTFDGTLAYRDSAGTGTLTQVGTITYATGYWAGTQGAEVLAGDGITSPGTTAPNRISPASGAIAIRFRRSVDTGGNQYLFSAGTTGSGQFLGIRADATTDRLVVQHRNGATDTFGQVITPVAGVAVDHFMYADWSGTAIRQALDGGVTTGTRAAPAASFDSASAMGFGCFGPGALLPLQGRVDAVAMFDAPLTDAERAALMAASAPWTWGMSLAASRRVLPVLQIGSSHVGPLRVGKD